jgi:hypothetical protein
MHDTLTRTAGITDDPASVYQLKRSAVDTYKTRQGFTSDEETWNALGVSKPTYYRLLRGAQNICTCRAETLAGRMGLDLDEAFDRAGRHG